MVCADVLGTSLHLEQTLSKYEISPVSIRLVEGNNVVFVQYIAVVTVFLFAYIPMGDLAKTKGVAQKELRWTRI